jgi:hypothetical protein
MIKTRTVFLEKLISGLACLLIGGLTALQFSVMLWLNELRTGNQRGNVSCELGSMLLSSRSRLNTLSRVIFSTYR